jgi:uncharacterized protein YcaQ
MSLLQIDTINVVARSPYLVLFSRLGSYPQHWLDESLRSGELMEYWAHEACFLPRSDFALVRHRMLTPIRWAGNIIGVDEEHAGSIQSCWRISRKMARFARPTLNIRAKAPAAGGSGNRISAIWKGCLPPVK